MVNTEETPCNNKMVSWINPHYTAGPIGRVGLNISSNRRRGRGRVEWKPTNERAEGLCEMTKQRRRGYLLSIHLSSVCPIKKLNLYTYANLQYRK